MNANSGMKSSVRVAVLIEIATVTLMFCLFAGSVVFMLAGCEHGSRINRTLDITYNWGSVSGSVRYSSGLVVPEVGIKVTGGNRTIYTESDGSFTLGNLAPGSYVLTAIWDGTHIENSGTVEVTVQGGLTASQDIVFGDTGLISGTVVAGTAKSLVSSALVVVGDERVTTGKDGTFFFMVKTGTHSLSVTKSGYQDVNQTGISVAKGADVEIEVELTSSTTTSIYKVSGSITDSDSAGVGGATVEFTSLADNSVAASVLTATDGTYLTSLTGGDYLVKAVKSGYVTSSTNVTIDDARSDLNLTLDKESEAATETGTITGKVTSAADDTAVSEVYVKATPDAGTPSFYEVYTGSDGTFSLSVTFPRTYTVDVSRSGYRSPGSEAVTVSSATTEIVNFSLIPLYRVSGTVKDATSTESITGATVELVRESDSGVEAATMTTTDGAFSVQVPYGYYRLVAEHADYSDASTVIDVSVDITSQEISMEFAQTGHTVSGLVYNVLSTGQAEKETLSFASLTFTLDGADDFSYASNSNTNGTFTMEAVYPGQYDILVEKGGFKDTTVTRTVMADVTGLEIPLALDVDPANGAIAGTVLDEATMEPISFDIGKTVEIVEIWGLVSGSTVELDERYGRFNVTAESGGQYYLLSIPTSVDMVLGLHESASGTGTVYTVNGTTRELSAIREVNLGSADKTYIYDIIKP